MTDKYNGETVLAVKVENLKGLVDGDGFVFNDGLAEIIGKRTGEFVPRAYAEADESRKQIIPYVVIKKDNMVYSYTRGKTSGEERLIDKLSIGFGGHVNECDHKCDGNPVVSDCIPQCVVRELKEEINADLKLARVINMGIINDDSDPVGRVHVGIVVVMSFIYDISPNEESISNARYRTIDELYKSRDRLETWSRLIIEHMAEDHEGEKK